MEYFQDFNVTNFKVFQPQGLENLLNSLIIGGCIVFSGNGLVFNFLISQFLSICFMKIAIFSSFFLTIFVIL